MKSTKVLLVGDDSYDMYVKAFYHSFQELGYRNTRLFATNRYLQAKSKIGEIVIKAENKFAFGKDIYHLNKQLLQYVKEMKPDFVFFYSARLVYADTIKGIKEQGNIIFIYNNDDPFAEYYPKYFWCQFKKSLQYADVGFAYRKKNIKEYYNYGCREVEMLRAYYIKNRNYYIPDVTTNNVPSVIFLGHNENDERQEYIRKLLDEKIEVGITERTWENFEVDNPYLVRLENSHKRYNEIMNGTKIAIVFLSKINNDTYTRRCFEIPVTKTLMVSIYTDDIASMFKEDEEVVFFRNEKEFVDKIKYYLVHDEERKKIAEAGYQRLMQDGHEVEDRVKYVLDKYEDIKKDRSIAE